MIGQLLAVSKYAHSKTSDRLWHLTYNPVGHPNHRTLCGKVLTDTDQELKVSSSGDLAKTEVAGNRICRLCKKASIL